MRIIFVRHGHPDYKNDCLTALGHSQAEAVAKRLVNENIELIFSSSCGRAVETAEHIAKYMKTSIERLDFMREVSWGPIDGKPIVSNGHPWFTTEDMIRNGQGLADPDWQSKEPFCRNKVTGEVGNVAIEFDKWLKILGYEREGLYYRVCKSNPNTVILVSHGGSSSAVLAHLFNLTFPFVCATMKPDFTSVTTVVLNGKNGDCISPYFELFNDLRHLSYGFHKNSYEM